MQQPTESEIAALLAQILNSPEFHESARYQELLRYLVNKSLTAAYIKEIDIAQDVFGKDSSFDPATDPLIRSYISNLRKKLEHYYLTTENQFAFKLEIPKGQYLAKYLPVAKKNQPGTVRKHLPAISLMTIALLIALVVVQETRTHSFFSPADPAAAVNPTWTDFVENNNRPTLIILGDFLVLSEKGKTDGRTFLRDPLVNSEKELREFSKTEPGRYGNYQISDVTYIGAGSALAVSEIVKVIGRSAKPFSVKLSSQLKWDDFDNNNIVYIGTLKTLDKLDTLFSRTNLTYKLHPNALSIKDSRKDSVFLYDLNWYGGSYQKDYSIIVKLRGSKNTSIVFLTGFSEVGVMESVKAAVDPILFSRINKFTNQSMNKDWLFFEMVSETEGVKYTVFRSEIKYFSPL